MENTPPPDDTSTRPALTALFLIFFFPIGVILMWLWMKHWPSLAKILITLLPTLTFILTFSMYVVISDYQIERETIELQDKVSTLEAIIRNYQEEQIQNHLSAEE